MRDMDRMVQDLTDGTWMSAYSPKVLNPLCAAELLAGRTCNTACKRCSVRDSVRWPAAAHLTLLQAATSLSARGMQYMTVCLAEHFEVFVMEQGVPAVTPVRPRWVRVAGSLQRMLSSF
jgi:hypothetical protein